MARKRYCARYDSVYLILLYAGSFVQAAHSLSDCPLDFSVLDLTSTVEACANVSYASCCDHSKALVAVAMSQYTRNTSNLQLPPGLLQSCLSYIGSVFEENDIQLQAASWCALNCSVLVDSPCQEIRDVKSIHESPGFIPVEASCGPKQSLVESASCQNCLKSQAKFHNNLINTRRISESWSSCADTIFLSIASLGDLDFAMEHANCFFQLQAPNATLQPQSRCPVTLQPGQIASISRTCNNSSRNGFTCCASALLELRLSLIETFPTSETLYISEKEGAACLEDLDSALLVQDGAQDSHTEFQICSIVPEDIFHNSTHGCHGISTMEEIHRILLEQEVDYNLLHEYCNVPSTPCERCRRAIVHAAVLVASTGGSGMKSKTLQSCSDLVFFALASNHTKGNATEIGSCFYSLPDIDNLALPPESPVPSSPIEMSSRVVLPFSRLMGIGLLVTIFLLVILAVFVVHLKKDALCPSKENPFTGKARMKNRKFGKDGAILFLHIRFSEIQRATGNFSTIIGRGGFGTVYKARFEDGLVAAVKRMNKGLPQRELEFCKEMELLGRLHHRHLVILRGYCAERHERLLVYEYCENGSLKENLHQDGGQLKQRLTWQRRLQIAFDVAAGLVNHLHKLGDKIRYTSDANVFSGLLQEYLHFYCEPPLYHRDIKSSNILLDENLTAKIADFGLAYVGRSGNSKFELVTSAIRGTAGYVDPEYECTNKLMEKSDVYSFGVLLLELITARRTISDNVRLVDWAQKYMYNESRIPLMVDSDLENGYSLLELKTLISIIKRCTQSDRKLRPTMQQTVRLLFDLNSRMDSSSRSPESHFQPGDVSSPSEGGESLSPDVEAPAPTQLERYYDGMSINATVFNIPKPFQVSFGAAPSICGNLMSSPS